MICMKYYNMLYIQKYYRPCHLYQPHVYGYTIHILHALINYLLNDYIPCIDLHRHIIHITSIYILYTTPVVYDTDIHRVITFSSKNYQPHPLMGLVKYTFW
ncbi:hypothetical protein GDO81_013874 [Engystomops pustulosus]|uniref:Uncharacterized protein n=1 Tax=Engystomops pustulosus TaxID=76066 RepID=A0AAV7B670_ENGPU|nr:hypothetical protein GDO81_013874 [Engystomops pustulosus]